MSEVWKEVEGYGGMVEVSDLGRVRNLDRVIEYSDGRKYSYKGKVLKQCVDHGGYLSVPININGKRRLEKSHRLVATAFVDGKSPDRNTVNHIDGNKQNNVPSNLEWCTLSENTRHAMKMGFIPTGQRHYLAKLTDVEAIEARESYKNNVKIQDLADRYGVCYITMYYIVKNKTYKEVGQDA